MNKKNDTTQIGTYKYHMALSVKWGILANRHKDSPEIAQECMENSAYHFNLATEARLAEGVK